jgi:phage tail-like protein
VVSSSAGLEGVDIRLGASQAAVELYPVLRGVSPDSIGLQYHRVRRDEGIDIILTNEDKRHRLLRLRVEGSRWKARWHRFSYITRHARDLQGGAALEAQDVLSEDDTVLQILVAAGETRRVRLGLVPTLDGETDAGIYAIDLVAEDISDKKSGGQSERLPALVEFKHPPSSFLAMLPGIYAEAMQDERRMLDDPGHSPFFERFLLGCEDAFRPLQQTLNSLDALFGPESAPPSFLIFLATWVCMPLDDNWPEMKRRRLIREAVELFRWRGTKRGLSRYIQIYTGEVPVILDQPVEGMTLGKAIMGDTKLGNVPPHTFVVQVSLDDPSPAVEKVLHDIIQFEKPAHTAYSLRVTRKVST